MEITEHERVLDEAVGVLACKGAPPLTWFVARDGAGRDLIAEAWAACEWHTRMIALVWVVFANPFRSKALTEWTDLRNSIMHPHDGPRCRVCGDAMRRVLPTVTLADVLAAHERRARR